MPINTDLPAVIVKSESIEVPASMDITDLVLFPFIIVKALFSPLREIYLFIMRFS